MTKRKPDARAYVRKQPGDRFGTVTLIEMLPRQGKWRVRCDCGTEMTTQTGQLKTIKSCQRGPCNNQWTDSPSYTLAHRRVRAAKGGATKQPCERCGNPAHAWAYNHQDPNEFLCEEIGSPYSGDPQYYNALCRTCHLEDDNAERRSLRRRIKELEARIIELEQGGQLRADQTRR